MDTRFNVLLVAVMTVAGAVFSHAVGWPVWQGALAALVGAIIGVFVAERL